MGRIFGFWMLRKIPASSRRKTLKPLSEKPLFSSCGQNIFDLKESFLSFKLFVLLMLWAKKFNVTRNSPKT
jgi:hypothetical protein